MLPIQKSGSSGFPDKEKGVVKILEVSGVVSIFAAVRAVAYVPVFECIAGRIDAGGSGIESIRRMMGKSLLPGIGEW